MRQSTPITTDIVLLGGGHAHVFVLKAFGMTPVPGVRLTLVAKELAAAYSGMLPGFVAGHYSLDDCQIDLMRLARFAGARLIHSEANGIDRAKKRVAIAGRPPIAYDLLSIDVGITPSLDEIAGAREHALAVKPVSVFAPKWQDLEARALTLGGPRRIAVIGGGAAGVELALAARHKLRTLAPAAGIAHDAFSFTLIAGGVLLPSHNARARALARRALGEAGVEVIENILARAITPASVELADGRSIPAGGVLISTKAAPPDWFAATDLPRDKGGFLAVRPTLQALDDDDVFAVGDCAAVLDHPREKSGVFAVRQGPAVAENLRRRALGEAARPFVPQRQFLSLISLGGRRAIASRGPFAVWGAWAWWWKDRIDRAFMDKFNMLPGMKRGQTHGSDPNAAAMRCGGCAAKVGPVTLARALDRVDGLTAGLGKFAAPHPNPLPGRTGRGGPAMRDDAAIIDQGGETLRLETVDFFRAFWPDPYVLGEIAANHAVSDIFAMGGRPERAQAIAVVPHARPRLVEEDLYQLLAGARAVFDREHVELIGGHSSEGAELSVGFAISGSAARGGLFRKSGLRPGDKLILAKPLGTGILFAAEMRGLANAGAIAAALAGMRRSNRAAADCFARHGATAATDITGFGLAGHLLEMLDASRTAAELVLGEIPTYPQVLCLARSGVASTLLPENLALASRLRGDPPPSAAARAVLFDPQTSGGLLAGVPATNARACVEDLRASGAPEAVIVGEVIATDQQDREPLRVTGDFEN